MKKLFILLCFNFACEFRISDQDAAEELRETETNISFGNKQVDDRNIHYAYTDNGNEWLLAFVHGSPGSWNAFIDFFKADTLIERFDLISIDRAGFGESGFGIAEPSIEIQAYQLHEVAENFSNHKIILIGHSLGAPVVARMAMDYPNSYHSLVLVGPSIDPEMEKDEWYRNVIDTKVGAFLTPKEFEVSNDEIIPLKKELEAMLPFWDKIKIPTIVIQGTDDSLVPKENADFARRMLPDSLLEVIMLEGVNHFIPWSHPQEITKAINRLTNDQ